MTSRLDAIEQGWTGRISEGARKDVLDLVAVARVAAWPDADGNRLTDCWFPQEEVEGPTGQREDVPCDDCQPCKLANALASLLAEETT